MAQMFLCYARENEAQVRELYGRLKGFGFELWMDKVNLLGGQRWRLEIPKALRASTLVLICLSSYSTKVGYLQREFKLALDTLQEIPDDLIHTIPVRLEPCTVPAQFEDLQWVDLFERDGFEQLLASIRHGLEQRGEQIPSPLETPPPTPAPTIILRPSFTNSIGMEFVLIPAGEFLMGTPKEQLDAIAGDDKDYREWIENETPQHKVTISQPFYLGKYEVTQAQWKAVMGDNPSSFTGDDNRPVENVSWEDAHQFIQKLNEREGVTHYRSPTEAEWEYAARAGTTTRYSFGNDATQLKDYAWYKENSSGTTHPVGEKKPNLWGLYDMHGNVWEWVQDWYTKDYYKESPSRDPQGPTTGESCVLRGGGWILNGRGLRSAHRVWGAPGFRGDYLGFRLARGQERQ